MHEEFYESEKCFRRYENYIHQALIAYPEEVRFEPEVRSAATDAARCRDAITAWRQKKWASALDPVAYKNILKDITAWQYLSFVCIGPRSLLKIIRGEPDPVCQQHKIKLLMATLKLPPKITLSPEALAELAIEEQEKFSQLTIERAVEMIEAGQSDQPYICENTPDNLSRVVAALEGKLNVVYVINKEKKIQIF